MVLFQVSLKTGIDSIVIFLLLKEKGGARRRKMILEKTTKELRKAENIGGHRLWEKVDYIKSYILFVIW
jgi:hypothetical protein